MARTAAPSAQDGTIGHEPPVKGRDADPEFFPARRGGPKMRTLSPKELEADLPKKLVEELRIFPPTSKEGRRFQDDMTGYVSGLYDKSRALFEKEHLTQTPYYYFCTHDFSKTPVRWLLAEGIGNNAIFVPSLGIPTIIVGASLFKPDFDSTQDVQIYNNFGLALWAVHEMTHKLMHDWLKKHPNSKFEEGWAESISLIMLAANKMDPEFAYEDLKRAAAAQKHLRSGIVGELMDPHLIPDDLKDVYNTTRTFIKNRFGDPGTRSEAPEAVPNGILEAARDGRGVSYVRSKLEGVTDYSSRSVGEKIKVLGRLIKGMKDGYVARGVDFGKEILALKNEIKTREDREAVHALSDVVLDCMVRFRKDVAFPMYHACSSLMTDDVLAIPLGRLRQISDIQRGLIRASSDMNRQVVRTKADELVTTVQREPLFATTDGRSFLEALSWPSFPLPDEADIRRVHKGIGRRMLDSLERERLKGDDRPYLVDYGSDGDDASIQFEQHERESQRESEIRTRYSQPDIDAEGDLWGSYERPESEPSHRKRKRPEAEPIRPSWRTLTDEAKNRSKSARQACILMGIRGDPELEVAIGQDSEFALSFYAGAEYRPSETSIGARLSSGPGGNAETLQRLLLDDEGDIIGHSDSTHFSQERISDIKYQIFDNLANGALRLKNSPTKSKLLERLRDVVSKHHARPHATQDENDPSLLNDPKAQALREGLLGFDSMETDFLGFLRINENVFTVDSKASAIIGRRLNETLTQGCSAQFRKAIREIFLTESQPAALNISLSSTQNKGELFHRNGFIQFLLSDTHRVLNKVERYGALHSMLSAYMMDDLATQNAEGVDPIILSKLSPICAGVGKPLPAASWEEVTEALRNDKKPSLRRTLLHYQVALLVFSLDTEGVDKPNLDALRELITVVDKGFFEKAIFLRETLAPHITREFEKKARGVKNAATDVHDWAIFSESGLLLTERKYKILSSVLDRVSALKPPQERMACAEEILRADSILDREVRAKFIGVWTDAIRDELRIDDSTARYRRDARVLIKRVAEVTPSIDREDVYSLLAKKIQAQKGVLKDITDKLVDVDHANLKHLPFVGVLAESSLTLFLKSKNLREETREYLLRERSSKSADQYLDKMKDQVRDYIDRRDIRKTALLDEEGNYMRDSFLYREVREQILHFYDYFWSRSHGVRSVIGGKLWEFGDRAQASSRATALRQALEHALSPTHPYIKPAGTYLGAYVDAHEPYELNLAVAAVMVAGQRGSGKALSIGEAICTVAEKEGPFQIKFVQRLSVDARVPPDIRSGTKRMKWAADEPHPWEVSAHVEDIRKEIEDGYHKYRGEEARKRGDDPAMVKKLKRARISHIGSVVGSGSIYVCVRLHMSDNTTLVVALKRPFVQERAKDGVRIFNRMIYNLGDSGEATTVMKDQIAQAQKRLRLETDPKRAPMQYAIGKKLFGDLVLSRGDRRVTFTSPDVVACGESFYVMEEMLGVEFDKLPTGTAEQRAHRKEAALFFLTAELRSVFNLEFDSDALGGNMKADGDQFSRIDLKGLFPHAWLKVGVKPLARVISQAVMDHLMGKLSKDRFSEIVLEEQRKIRARLETQGKGKSAKEDRLALSFISELQTAFHSYGDLLGELNDREILCAFVSALTQGIHPDLKSELVASAPGLLRSKVERFLDGDRGAVPIVDESEIVRIERVKR